MGPPNCFESFLGTCCCARQAASPPRTAAGGGGGVSASPKNGPSPRTPPQEAFSEGLLRSQRRGRGHRAVLRQLGIATPPRPGFPRRFPGSTKLINPREASGLERELGRMKEKGFWSPALVCRGPGLGLSPPPRGSQRQGRGGRWPTSSVALQEGAGLCQRSLLLPGPAA